jgi:hypothetical protein
LNHPTDGNNRRSCVFLGNVTAVFAPDDIVYYFATFAAPRGAAGATRADFFLRSEKFFQKIRIGLAIKIDE